jgi:hypothetical protein
MVLIDSSVAITCLEEEYFILSLSNEIFVIGNEFVCDGGEENE